MGAANPAGERIVTGFRGSRERDRRSRQISTREFGCPCRLPIAIRGRHADRDAGLRIGRVDRQHIGRCVLGGDGGIGIEQNLATDGTGSLAAAPAYKYRRARFGRGSQRDRGPRQIRSGELCRSLACAVSVRRRHADRYPTGRTGGCNRQHVGWRVFRDDGFIGTHYHLAGNRDRGLATRPSDKDIPTCLGRRSERHAGSRIVSACELCCSFARALGICGCYADDCAADWIGRLDSEDVGGG